MSLFLTPNLVGGGVDRAVVLEVTWALMIAKARVAAVCRDDWRLARSWARRPWVLGTANGINMDRGPVVRVWVFLAGIVKSNISRVSV